MKPFYSLVRIVPGPSESDIITVGLLAHNGERLQLRLSPYKLRLARHFFKADVSAWVDAGLKQLQRKIDDANKQLAYIADRNSSPQQLLVLSIENINRWFAFEFSEAEYVHRYYNGILQFTAPTPIATELTGAVFDTLYKALVFADNEVELPNEEEAANVRIFQERLENKLLKRVANKVNINLPVREHVLPSLHYQFEMDCIGINGALVGAFAMDFSQSPTTTDKKFGHYVDVINRLVHKYQRQDKDNAFYLIADEPPASAPAEKIRQWRSWREAPSVELIGSKDVAQVAERIERTNAHPLVPFADTLGDDD